MISEGMTAVVAVEIDTDVVAGGAAAPVEGGLGSVRKPVEKMAPKRHARCVERA